MNYLDKFLEIKAFPVEYFLSGVVAYTFAALLVIIYILQMVSKKNLLSNKENIFTFGAILLIGSFNFIIIESHNYSMAITEKYLKELNLNGECMASIYKQLEVAEDTEIKDALVKIIKDCHVKQ
jgi:hypothetical protein